MNFFPINSIPTHGPDVLVALRVFGSPDHPTKAKEFLRWDFAVAEVYDDGFTVPADCGWSHIDFTHWARIPSPTIKSV